MLKHISYQISILLLLIYISDDIYKKKLNYAVSHNYYYKHYFSVQEHIKPSLFCSSMV